MQTAGGPARITVSTLAEARAFAANGFADITYAVPVEPGKFDEVSELARRCERFSLITDDASIPPALDDAARRAGITLDLFLKVDCGYHRCGVEPDAPEALEIPRLIADARHLRFAGILTHAGHSYHARSHEELLSIARHERDLMREFAERLRADGVEVPTISVGSTPTITHVDHLEGVDEARPGNYIFFDAFQATLGSCGFADCALTVLASVVHRDPARRKIVLDAGAIALSKDRGPVELDSSCGYGRVQDLEGSDLGLRVGSLSQEHGEVIVEDASQLERLRVGARVRVLANHSCLTAAQHTHYNVVEGGRVVEQWKIHGGW
jgi:D-serine deaminase-like pyridoxal phosphate-dependent protein